MTKLLKYSVWNKGKDRMYALDIRADTVVLYPTRDKGESIEIPIQELFNEWECVYAGQEVITDDLPNVVEQLIQRKVS